MSYASENLKAFIKGSSVLIFSNFVLKAIQFFLLPLYTKYLAPDVLGVTDAITSFTSLILPLFVMAFDSAFSAFYYDEKTDNHYNKVFNTVSFFLVIQSIVTIIIAIFASKHISMFLFESEEYSLGIIIAMFSISVNMLFVPFSLWIRMKNRMTVFAIINVTASFVMIATNIIFVAVLQLGYISLIVSLLIVNILQLILYIICAKVKIHRKYVNKNLFKKMMFFALPLLPTTIFSWLLAMSDRWLILFFIDESALGIYGVAARFVTVMAAVISGVSVAYTTFAFQNAKEDGAKEVFSDVVNVVFALLAIIATSVAITGKELIALMTASGYHSAYLLLAGLLFAQLIIGVNTLIGYGIAFEKKSKFYLLSVAVGSVVTVTLNVIFLPIYGLEVAAIASFIGYLCLFIVTYFYSQKFYPCNYGILKMAISFAVMFALSLLFRDSELIIKIPLCIVITIIIVIMYKGRFKNIYTLLKIGS